jgi:hypothetical protein
MHTSQQLERSQFSITIAGQAADREDLFPSWHAWDRLGVVIHEPLGALGASQIIQVAITAFYDERPERTRQGTIQYPEIFALNVGGRFGDLSDFDFWPERKQVFLDASPTEVLAAINNLAITRLLVPEGPVTETQHVFKEPESARERIASAFAYSATGRVSDADVVIAGLDRRVEMNANQAMDPEGSLAMLARAVERSPSVDMQHWLDYGRARRDELSAADCERAVARRAQLLEEGLPTESYRRVSVDDALGMLV